MVIGKRDVKLSKLNIHVSIRKFRTNSSRLSVNKIKFKILGFTESILNQWMDTFCQRGIIFSSTIFTVRLIYFSVYVIKISCNS